MKTKLLIACAVAALGPGCSSSDTNCGDGGCLDGGAFTFDGPAGDVGPSYTPVNGNYKVTAFTAGTDGCKIGPEVLLNATDPAKWLPVSVDSAGNLKIGNPRGTPAIASLGEGPLIGNSATLRRMNHVAVEAPSTCQYDSDVTSTVALDDATKMTIGMSITEKQSNRTTCDLPAGVGTSCSSTWSWRLTPQP
jgi:hypothetical protein